MLSGPGGPAAAVNSDYDHNVYWCSGVPSLSFAGKSWDEWRTMGKDGGSIIAIPVLGIRKMATFESRTTPALQVGFVPWLK